MSSTRIACALLALTAACVPPTMVAKRAVVMPPLTSTDSAQYAAYSKPGTSTVTGQAFLTTRGGDVKVGAGRVVTLDPATSYALKYYAQLQNDVAAFGHEAPCDLFVAARKTTVADAQGKFAFADLPAGTYVVRTTVTWEVPSGSAFLPMEMQGGVLTDTISVAAGQTKNLILNHY